MAGLWSESWTVFNIKHRSFNVQNSSSDSSSASSSPWTTRDFLADAFASRSQSYSLLIPPGRQAEKSKSCREVATVAATPLHSQNSRSNSRLSNTSASAIPALNDSLNSPLHLSMTDT
ncbi:hypothetical protein GALMADRAFT_133851 [Galerina marginata CBS 339.88]|uniref:Uncharacterized protein n=1 Tax=Galerina marginata (strain CBS 339.88) TaxID=685588 RepID=A0A067TMZ7_GALM3|nr:hypothetical protein GALMADRAFT_133851 [Galerina marginata CBS 339.88]